MPKAQALHLKSVGYLWFPLTSMHKQCLRPKAIRPYCQTGLTSCYIRACGLSIIWQALQLSQTATLCTESVPEGPLSVSIGLPPSQPLSGHRNAAFSQHTCPAVNLPHKFSKHMHIPHPAPRLGCMHQHQLARQAAVRPRREGQTLDCQTGQM